MGTFKSYIKDTYENNFMLLHNIREGPAYDVCSGGFQIS